MESRAICQKASNNFLDIKAREAKDASIKRNETKSVSYGIESKFTRGSVSAQIKDTPVLTGFGKTDIGIRASKGGDHLTSEEPSTKYLGDTIPSELNHLDRLSLCDPEKAKALLDGSKPFMLENEILDKDGRSQLYGILQPINSNGNYYGNYEFPQGSDSYNHMLSYITANKDIGKFFKKHDNNSNWQLEKIYVQIDQDDLNKGVLRGRYRSDLDSYRVIGLFTPKNNFEKE